MASPFPERLKNFFRDYWALVLLVVLFSTFFILFLFGWRLGQGGMPVRTGDLVVLGVPDGTYAYVDEVMRHRVGANGETSLSLIPGLHTVIVDAPGMQPWNELFEVRSGEDAVVSPILVPKEPEFRTMHDEERDAAARALYLPNYPTKAKPLLLEGGCAQVYIANNRVLADATTTPTCAAPAYLLCPAEEGGVRDLPCPSSTVIFPGSERLDSMVAFPGRDDALLIAAGSSIYVVELDPRSPQFFAPLLKGERVRVGTSASGSVIFSDRLEVYEFTPYQAK